MLIFGDKTRGLIGLATDRLCSAMRNTAARMPWGKIRRQESTDTIGAAMIDLLVAGLHPKVVVRSTLDIIVTARNEAHPSKLLVMLVTSHGGPNHTYHGSAYSVSAFLPPYLAPRHSGCSVSHG